MSLAKKVFRSSTLNLVEQFVQLAVVFFVTPLMIRHLGETQYGVWLISMAIVGYYKLLDLGITLAGTRFLAGSIGADDSKDYQINVSTLFTIYRRIALATIPITLVAAAIATHFIQANEYTRHIRWILLAFGLNIAIRFFTRIFSIILRSHVRYDLIVLSSLIKTVIQGCLVIYFLLHGAGLLALIVIHITTDLLDQLFLFFLSSRTKHHAKISTALYNRDRAIEILRSGFTAFLVSAGNSFRNGIDPLVIGSINGLDKVPFYSIGNRFLRIFLNNVNAVFGGHLLAAFSQLETRDGRKSVRDNFFKMIRLSSAFAMLGGCALSIYAPPLIERWIGPNYADSGTVVLILVIPYVLMLAQFPAKGLFWGIGRHRYIAYIGFGGGILNLMLSLILAVKIGFFGVVWATFIELSIAYLLILPILVSRSIEVSVLRYLGSLIPGFLKAGIPSLIWFIMIRRYIEPDYLTIFSFAIGHAIIALSFLWYSVLNKKERNLILTMFLSKFYPPTP